MATAQTDDPRLRCAAGELTQCVVAAEHYRDRAAPDHDARLAITYFKRACAGNEATACAALGDMALRGEAGARDLRAASRWLGAACAGKHAVACRQLGELQQRQGDGMTARVHWQTACELQDTRACVWLNETTLIDEARCTQLTVRCDDQAQLACALLAKHSLDGECTIAIEDAARLAQTACAHDEVEGCYQVARAATGAYVARPAVDGSGAASGEVPRVVLGPAVQMRERLSWACDADHASACALLAKLWQDASIGPPSHTASANAARRGCDLGDVSACFMLANALIATSHSREQGPQIVSLLRRACDAWIAGACRRLGDVLLDGDAALRDRAEAEHAFAQGCEQADAAACASLADVYGYRASLSPDEGARKRDWMAASVALGRACELGAARACVRQGLLALHGVSAAAAASHPALLAGCRLGAAEGCLYAGWQLALGHDVTADATQATALLAQACSAGSVLACEDHDLEALRRKHADRSGYPTPYAIGVAVPARYREASSAPVAADHETPRAPDSAHEQRDAAPSAEHDEAWLALGVDVGGTGQGNGQAGRVVLAFDAAVNEQSRLRLRVPMIVADASLDLPPEDARAPGTTSASSFRFGNVAIGMTAPLHDAHDAQWSWRYGVDLIAPLALAPAPDDDGLPSLEQQLAQRTYELGAAIDGMREAWLFVPNSLGAAAHLEVEHRDALWLVRARLSTAVLAPLRVGQNAELVGQLEATAGEHIGPLMLGVRGALVAMADAELFAPSVSAFVALFDRNAHVWSLRATTLLATSPRDVPSWGVSIGYGAELP